MVMTVMADRRSGGGCTLARAHARSGDRIALAAYLGGSAKFDEAIAATTRHFTLADKCPDRAVSGLSYAP